MLTCICYKLCSSSSTTTSKINSIFQANYCRYIDCFWKQLVIKIVSKLTMKCLISEIVLICELASFEVYTISHIVQLYIESPNHAMFG